METDTDETVVIFRVWNKANEIIGDDVLALFPHEKANNKGDCMSYEHVGQHGGADYTGCIARTRPAQPKEYRALKIELEGLGYRLKIRRRMTP